MYHGVVVQINVPPCLVVQFGVLAKVFVVAGGISIDGYVGRTLPRKGFSFTDVSGRLPGMDVIGVDKSLSQVAHARDHHSTPKCGFPGKNHGVGTNDVFVVDDLANGQRNGDCVVGVGGQGGCVVCRSCGCRLHW